MQKRNIKNRSQSVNPKIKPYSCCIVTEHNTFKIEINKSYENMMIKCDLC